MTLEDLFPNDDYEQFESVFREVIRKYRQSLPTDRKHLLEQYKFSQLARKVVGVGSVGTRCWIVLMHGPRHDDVLFLQAKEAEASVLERFTKKSQYANHGARVVAGQRLMQASSDICSAGSAPWGSTGSPATITSASCRTGRGPSTPKTRFPRA